MYCFKDNSWRVVSYYIYNMIKVLAFNGSQSCFLSFLILDLFITASKILSLPGSFGKKKTESQPPSPLHTRHYQNGAANSPKVRQSRPSPVAVKKTPIPEGNKSFPSLSSDEISIDLNGQHDSFNHKPEKPSRTVPLSPNSLVCLNYPLALIIYVGV